MPRLILDEGLPLRSAQALRDLGIDAVHAREVGLTSAPDPVVLDFARAEGRVCFTLDHDFHRLLAETGANRPSVVLIRLPKLTYSDATELIATIVDQLGAQLHTGIAATATRKGIRLRLLPLK